jgi:SAM-dependent methyltransferase
MNPALPLRLRQALVVFLRPQGKFAFVRDLPPHAKVLDVGCGNNSPFEFKTLRPDIVYHGLDVHDFNQQAPVTCADSYVIAKPAEFAQAIRAWEGQMDAVVSAHNLEHCDDPQAVLRAMMAALRPGGRLYLAFPCEESVRFPHRRGTLNFHDDTTHRDVPSWALVVRLLEQEGFELRFARKRYRPRLLALAGLLLEPLGMLTRRNMPAGSTWALYGFESVLWAARPGAA